jgi:hypothetical protein
MEERRLLLMVLLDRSVVYAGILMLSLCASALKQKESGFFLCWIYHGLVFPLNLMVQFLVTISISFYRPNLVYKQIYSQVVRRPASVRLSRFIAVWEEHATELHLPSLKLVHTPAPCLFEINFNIFICT